MINLGIFKVSTYAQQKSVSRELSNYLIIVTQQTKFRGIREEVSALLQTDSFWNELSFQEIIRTQRSGCPECFTR